MKKSTKLRHRLIRNAFNELAGTLPLMKIYERLARKFDLNEDYIRQILHKKPP